MFKGAFSFSHFGKSGLARKSLANDITPAFTTFLKDPERVTYYSLGQRLRFAELILLTPEAINMISALLAKPCLRRRVWFYAID